MNVIAVDVGTTSVRLAIVSFENSCSITEVKTLSSHEKVISHRQDGLKFEQNSSEIWKAICECCHVCIEKLGSNRKLQVSRIRAMAFSATCSLVVEMPMKKQDEFDIIMWMDHRATKEAEEITVTKSKVLDQFGGVCSPEFSLSKLLWLKRNEPKRFESAIGFFELPDWLVYRCGRTESLDSGADSPRSLCCLSCKWGFENGRHCEEIHSIFDNDLNLIDKKLGKFIKLPGSYAGKLSDRAREELGLLSVDGCDLLEPISLATSLIDAHSGALAMLPVIRGKINSSSPIETILCSLAGTSSCHMLLSKINKKVSGIWGPYKDAILRDFYLLEAGQSMTGKLIEICIESHPEGKRRLEAGESFSDIVQTINSKLLNHKPESEFSLQSPLHVLPSYHGNRSPLANPRLLGGIYGLSAENRAGHSLEDHYLATVDALAYELMYIVEKLETPINVIMVSGGLNKNRLFMQKLADVLRIKVYSMSLGQVDAMLIGAALLARQAALATSIGDQVGLSEEDLQNINYESLELCEWVPKSETFYHKKKYICYKMFVDFSLQADVILSM